MTCSVRHQNRYIQAWPEGIWSLQYCPGFLAQRCVQRLTVRLGTGKRDLHEMWKEALQNSPKPPAIFFPCYFRELCQVLDGIEISSAVWTQVPLWFCPFTTEHLTISQVLVDIILAEYRRTRQVVLLF